MDSEKDYRYQNRGIKEFDLYLDDMFIKKVELEKASYLLKGTNSTKVKVSSNCKKVKFVIDNQIGVVYFDINMICRPHFRGFYFIRKSFFNNKFSVH